MFAIQDYAPRRPCVRLIGVSPHSFDESTFNADHGCETYVIDVDWSDFLSAGHPLFLRPWKPWFGDRPIDWYRHFASEFFEEGFPPALWLKIQYQQSQDVTGNYAYRAFSNEELHYLNLSSLTPVQGTAVRPPPDLSPGTVDLNQNPEAPTLTAFHVGQGICTLLANDAQGVLFDAGAGTPVTREVYRSCKHPNGSPFINKLISSTQALRDLTVVLSHPDSDHWRILEWDQKLLQKVTEVLLPSGQPALAFKSPAVLPKVKGIRDRLFRFANGDELKVMRSEPRVSDRNGECLVAVARVGGSKGLLAGDYVYDRMAVDMRPDGAISTLPLTRFDAVVVPHHGDKASSSSVPFAVTRGISPAFFSAGTHVGYRHPRNVSLVAHENSGYFVIDNHTQQNILARQLLP
ncbi:MAG: hypothetical protein IV085_13285 [Thiobacillus sp.]|nr:hypothetical protein [Thiobacillus sp.]